MKKIIMLLLCMISFVGCGIETIENKIEILSLSLNQETQGAFILGCGYVGTMLMYYVYTKTDDGGYILLKCDVDNSKIYEKNETPHIIYTDVIRDGIKYQLSKRTITGKYSDGLGYSKKIIKIIVPPNTIIQEYKAQ